MRKLEVLRTPDERFENLPDYDFSPNYVEIHNLRIHYVDEGSRNADPILLLHGEPSWSYLYRKMISPLVDAGFRVIAPDLMGFGRSDKLLNMKDYTYQKHVNVMLEFLDILDLQGITLFCQDWGGMIGLRLIGEYPDIFARIIAANTGFPSAGGLAARIGPFLFKRQVRQAGVLTNEDLQKEVNLIRWVACSRTVPVLDIGNILQAATTTTLSDEVLRAYRAPFPSEAYKAGARIFPSLIPTQLAENQRVWDKVLSKWEKPFLTTFSDKDPITAGGEKFFQKKIPGAQGQDHVTIKDAGHFLQEDKGEELAQVILDFISRTS